jgi:hypothetical protein
MPARTGKLGAAVAARAKPINHLWALMDERCTCRRCVRDRIGLRGFMPPPARKWRVCAGARVSLKQWQDWRSGGRGLRSATWGGTLVGVRVRFVAGGEKQGEGYGEG